MATSAPPCSAYFLSFLLLLFPFANCGCKRLPSDDDHAAAGDDLPGRPSSLRRRINTRKRHKISPLSSSSTAADDLPTDPCRTKDSTLSSVVTAAVSFLRCFSGSNRVDQATVFHRQPPPAPLPAPLLFSSPPHAAHLALLSPAKDPATAAVTATGARQPGCRSFASRVDVFPCAACGEVMTDADVLDRHQSAQHRLTELLAGDSGAAIVRMIFFSGWGHAPGPPTLRRVLKVNHHPLALARFEECRATVRGRADADERCVADGNERLRFYCTTLLCSPHYGTCESAYCSTCAVLRHGFAGKSADADGGVTTYGTAWAAHRSLPEDLEREFAFLHARRAMLVCRVIAGRVCQTGAAGGSAARASTSQAWDSLVPARQRRDETSGEDDEELLVLDPSAVLPCFVVVYTGQ